MPVKQKALDKVRKQLVGVSALVDFWWQGVWQDMQQVTLTPMWTRWIEEVLLPLMYWQQQVSRTRCPRRKAKTLQRASSAVEGRNGYLSQMHHNHRGLPKRRYKVWRVLHNFDCRASDGTTPASRFFRRGFPDLFETVLSQVQDWPRSRKHPPVMTLSA